MHSALQRGTWENAQTIAFRSRVQYMEVGAWENTLVIRGKFIEATQHALESLHSLPQHRRAHVRSASISSCVMRGVSAAARVGDHTSLKFVKCISNSDRPQYGHCCEAKVEAGRAN